MSPLTAAATPAFLGDCDPRVQAIYEYWDGKRNGRRMPSRGDIDPVEIPSFLPCIILVDVSHDPVVCRYRLVGTDIVYRRGFDPTGKTVGDTYLGGSREQVLRHYREVVNLQTVKYVDEPFVEPRGWPVKAERLMMPLSNDGDRVDMVFIYAIWNEKKG